MRELCVAAILAPIHDDNLEGEVALEQRGFVRGASNANDKVIPTFFGELALSLYFQHLHVNEESPRAATVLVEVIRFDLPERARCQLQRVEVLPVDERIPAGKGVVRNPVGALVVQVITAEVLHRDGLALRAALSLRGFDWTQRREIRPFWLWLGRFFWRGFPRSGLCFRRGPCVLGISPFQLIRLQRFFDGESHHHHTRHNHRPHDELRCRQDADPEPLMSPSTSSGSFPVLSREMALLRVLMSRASTHEESSALPARRVTAGTGGRSHPPPPPRSRATRTGSPAWGS